MTDNAASPAGSLVTGSDIARLAGVTRAAVSNWRRRYEDFPAPAGGSANSPLYALAEVQAWLAKQRKGQEVSPEVELWQTMRAAYGEQMQTGLAEVAGLLAGEDAPEPPDDVAGRVRELSRTASPADVVTGLAERFMDSARRAGSDQVTSERVVRAVCHFAPRCPPAGRCSTRRAASDRCCCRSPPTTERAAAARRSTRTVRVSPSSGPTSWAGRRCASSRATPCARTGGRTSRPTWWSATPAGVTEWGREELLLDSRWELGTPSKAEGELAWLQHAYAHTAPGGQVLMVMPASVAISRRAGASGPNSCAEASCAR